MWNPVPFNVLVGGCLCEWGVYCPACEVEEDEPQIGDPDPNCTICAGMGMHLDSFGDLDRERAVECDCVWRHLRPTEVESEDVLF